MHQSHSGSVSGLTSDRKKSSQVSFEFKLIYILHSSTKESMDPTEIVTTVLDESHDHEEKKTDSYSQDANDDLREGLTEIPVQVVISNKLKTSKATTEQKELMLEFVQENPEIITHSSTTENERNLWEDFTNKLNALKPEKPQENWKNVWYRWQASVFKKPENKLQCLDIKLKKFLTQLRSDCDGRMVISPIKPKKRMNSEQIDNVLKDIEKEKYSLHLEIDENEISIQKFKVIIKHLENENLTKHQRMKKLNDRKVYLNSKKRKILVTETEDIEVLEKAVVDIQKG